MDDFEKLWERLNARALESRKHPPARHAKKKGLKFTPNEVEGLRRAFDDKNTSSGTFYKSKAKELSCSAQTIHDAVFGLRGYRPKP